MAQDWYYPFWYPGGYQSCLGWVLVKLGRARGPCTWAVDTAPGQRKAPPVAAGGSSSSAPSWLASAPAPGDQSSALMQRPEEGCLSSRPSEQAPALSLERTKQAIVLSLLSPIREAFPDSQKWQMAVKERNQRVQASDLQLPHPQALLHF